MVGQALRFIVCYLDLLAICTSLHIEKLWISHKIDLMEGIEFGLCSAYQW